MGDFGKFASSKELLAAYEELEKSYTKKCQKLADLIRKMQDEPNDESAKNAENLCKNEEYSVKNVQNAPEKTENTENKEEEKLCGTIANKDACCDSTEVYELVLDPDVADAKEREEQDNETSSSKQPRPVYLSPLFGLEAKEFFDSCAVAAAFEREILELIAKDSEISIAPNALALAAARVVGVAALQPVFSDKFVEALCAMPQVKKRVVDLYLAELRDRDLPPMLIKTRTSAASQKAKFSSIAEASKHLLSRL